MQKKKINKIAIISCVNNFETYEQFKETILPKEYLKIIPVDNTTNIHSVPSAYNTAMKSTDADIFIFIHQDVLLFSNWLETVENQISQVELSDKNWGVLGIMGIKKNGLFAGHIKDVHTNKQLGKLPVEVSTLDEVCLILQRKNGLSFDDELGGYHFYGADICLQARKKGLKCYAIDACLTHLSGGKKDELFYNMLKKLQNKWTNQPSSPYVIQTTCGVFPLKKGIISIILRWLIKKKERVLSYTYYYYILK